MIQGKTIGKQHGALIKPRSSIIHFPPRKALRFGHVDISTDQ
jgi:hypothetical protein